MFVPINCSHIKSIKVKSKSKYFSSEKSFQSNKLRDDLEILGKKLNIKKLEDWYGVKINFEKEEIFNDGKYLHEILASAYPEYDWIPWSFVSLNPNYWNKKDNCKKFLDWFAAKKGIHSENEWYSISKTEIANYGGQKLLEKHYNGSLYQVYLSFFF